MPVIAFCQDGSGAPCMRADAARAHDRHVLDQLERLALVTPMARSDEATVVGHTRLAGSLIAYLADDIDAARLGVLADPYMQGGGWGCVDLYSTRPLFGTWSGNADAQREAFRALLAGAPMARSSGARRYAVFCEGEGSGRAPESLRLDHARHLARLFDHMLLGAQLDLVERLGPGSTVSIWHALYIFLARDLEQAARFAKEDPFAAEGLWRTEVFALPGAVGAWAERP